MRLKRGLSWAFFLLLAVQSMGTYPTFALMQKRIRSEVKAQIKAGIPESELVGFTWSEIESEIRWSKPEKEFWYRGTPYDVIRWDGGRVICFPDIKERGLFAVLDQALYGEDFAKTPSRGLLAVAGQFFFASYTPSPVVALAPVFRSPVAHDWGYLEPSSTLGFRKLDRPPMS